MIGQDVKPGWWGINEKVIKENNIKGRTRSDIPQTNVKSNLRPGDVINIRQLPNIDLAPGVLAKAYWGDGALMSFITFEPNSFLAKSTIKGERFLFVLEGEVKELVNGKYVSLIARKRDVPDGVHGATPKREFIYLQEGAASAIRAGINGAKVLEVYSPVPVEYLKMAGVAETPAKIDITKFPIRPMVEPNKVYDLYDFQYSELVPGANSRIISGYGVQMSFLRMDPNIYFPYHIHPEQQVMINFDGWIDELILDKKAKMEYGDIVNLEPDLVHGGKLGPLGSDALDVFFPPRTDYNSFRLNRQAGYDAIIPPTSKAKIVIDGSSSLPGLSFTEGPTWLNGKLYFSNIAFDENFNGFPQQSTLVEMTPDGNYRNIIENQMLTNGTASLKSGNLVVCDMYGHRLIEVDKEGKIIRVLADSYDGKPLDGPNDVIVDSKGGVYFSDPQFTSDKIKSQLGTTVYYLNAKGKLLRLLKPGDFSMPNGLALSPDEKTLYIANTYDDEAWRLTSDKGNYIWAYDVAADGTISNGRKFAQLYLTRQVLDRRAKSSGADGLKVDEAGNLYVCTWIGLQIFNSKGDFVGIVNLPTYPVNCAFGGDDMKTLYITSYDKIYSIRTNIKGRP